MYSSIVMASSIIPKDKKFIYLHFLVEDKEIVVVIIVIHLVTEHMLKEVKICIVSFHVYCNKGCRGFLSYEVPSYLYNF